MDRVASILAQNGLNFKLREGYSAETSGKLFTNIISTLHFATFNLGGLMVCLPRDKAEAFCAEIEVCLVIVHMYNRR